MTEMHTLDATSKLDMTYKSVERRAFLRLCPLCASSFLYSAPAKANPGAFSPENWILTFQQEWKSFRQKFLGLSGRIIDTRHESKRSHSEGQGWGLIFSSLANDEDAFQRILAFTMRMKRQDADLFRWAWIPNDPKSPALGNPNEIGQMPDSNNATDGDIYIATGLYFGYMRWGNSSYVDLAKRIVQSIERHLLRSVGEYKSVLIPGLKGFEAYRRVVINPSYFVVHAFEHVFRQLGNGQLWLRVHSECMRILDVARFGNFGLPPDWLALPHNPKARPFPEREYGMGPVFGYDAVRIPILLIWGGHKKHHHVFNYVRFAEALKPQRPWINLTNNVVPNEEAFYGMRFIREVCEAAIGVKAHARLEDTSGEDYYSHALVMLALVACYFAQINVYATT